MIGHWWLETVRLNTATHQDVTLKTIFPQEDHGLYLVDYDAPPPKVRTYRTTVEGRDGALDLTEWEGPGIVRYNDRTVTVRVREIDGRHESNRFVGDILGKRVHLHFDDDPDYYYTGRCDQANTSTRNHVTNIELTFTCQPFRTAQAQKTMTFTAPPRISAAQPSITNFTIEHDGSLVEPTLYIDGVEDGYATGVYSMLWWSSADVTSYYFYSSEDDGEIATRGVYIRNGTTNFAITNSNASDDLVLTVTWRDEVM